MVRSAEIVGTVQRGFVGAAIVCMRFDGSKPHAFDWRHKKEFDAEARDVFHRFKDNR